LSDLVRKTNAFEIDLSPGRAMRIRIKPAVKKSDGTKSKKTSHGR